MRKLTIALGFMLLNGCASFLPAEKDDVMGAVHLQNFALQQPEFEKIMRQLEAQGAVDWKDRLDSTAQAESQSAPGKMDWLLGKLRSEGGSRYEDIEPWFKFNPRSSTVALTNPHDGTRLNLWKLSRDPVEIANTLAHEHVHVLGVLHPVDQTRGSNMCDPSYLTGDLVEDILRNHLPPAQRVKFRDDEPVCPALCAAITQNKMWSICP